MTRYVLLSIFILAHIICVLSYLPDFRTSLIYGPRFKKVHFVFLWLVPFVWVFLLKAFAQDTPGSWEIDEKSDREPWSGLNN